MKIFLFSLLAFSLLTACNVKPTTVNEQHSSIVVSMILDVTDPRSYWPGADQILPLYHCKQTPDAECVFRLRTISDKRLTPIVAYRLADADNLEKENIDDDLQFRKKNILAFYSTVRKAVNDLYSRTDTAQSLNNSECFRSIADELSFLAKSKSKERILVIASDLMEKSDLMNCYTTNLTNPTVIASQFEQFSLLPQSLTGITVIFLFSPRDRKQDIEFGFIVEAYKELLQCKGAEIKIQANL
jgi:hypothetical protein